MAGTKQDRAEAQRRVVEAMAQHASHLYRASTGTSNKITAIIDEMGGTLSRELADRLDNLSPAEMQALARGKYTTSRLEGVRNVIESWSKELDTRIKARFSADGEALAGQEVKYTEALLNGVLVESVAAGITAKQAFARAMEQPVLGEFVEDMLTDMSDRTKRQVYSTIRQGVTAGQTNAEMVRALRGTQRLKFKDGVLQSTRVEAERITRTGRSHISNSAYTQTHEALSVEYVVDCATLDGRVSKYCAVADGRRHKVGTNHPRPPYHPNCRTVQVASFDGEIMGKRPYVRAFQPVGKIPKAQRPKDMIGQVSAKTTYPDWFGRQPAGFQKEWLGEKRYALYKQGGYKIDRFVDPLKGKEYTLDQLRARDAETFAQLFGG